MRARLGFTTVGIIVALALMSTGAGATGAGRAASACPTQTSKDAVGRTWSWRVVLHGKVSCAQAIRTNLAYIRATREGRCTTEICTEVTFAGGWTCSSVIPTLEKKLAPVVGECDRKGASFDIDKISLPTSTPGTLHLAQFLSPDRKVWCSVGTSTDVSGRSCGTNPEPPTRSAEIDSHGDVTICSVPRLIVPPGGHVPEGCFQNWNYKAPVLKYGQATEEDGVRCTSATNGITCIKVAGAGKGKGFRINKDEAVEER
jgi:hypothetical protein